MIRKNRTYKTDQGYSRISEQYLLNLSSDFWNCRESSAMLFIFVSARTWGEAGRLQVWFLFKQKWRIDSSTEYSTCQISSNGKIKYMPCSVTVFIHHSCQLFEILNAGDCLCSINVHCMYLDEILGGRGYLGQVLLSMCRWPLSSPTPL